MIPRFLVSFWMRARPALWPLSLLYGAGVRLRFSLYRYGLLSRTHPGVPSIAIGNLSLGGEGKTPLTLT
ncbi:tetraacyldisaccharide 4'-kinase, partial [Thermosulfurimonas sp.]|uniref:tetraacyldisaccharide 4'-kinase n=1 Tax=Thermosulfurimonas sp. TaxID=2080236 RepID=UPI0025F0015B